MASAKTKKITEYSITEHVSQFREARKSIKFGSVHSTGRIFESLKEYIDEFRKADEQTWEMKVNRGLEVDFSPRYEAVVGNFVNQEEWDILLCSIHEFDGKDIERIDKRTVNPAFAQRRWREYLEQERIALESDFVPFQVLSHPVRISRSVKIVPPEFDDLLLDLARTARRKEKALELNGSDIDYAPELVRKLAMACSKAGCRVSLGSDAHYPSEVFRNIRVAIGLAEEFKLELTLLR